MHRQNQFIHKPHVAVHAALTLWAVICVFPVYWLLVTSLKRPDDIDGPARYLPFVDFQPTLESWRFILFDAYENLIASLINSILVCFTATALSVTIGSLAAYGLSRFNFGTPNSWTSSSGVGFFILATRILPPVVLAVPLYVMFTEVNLGDTRTALIVTYTAINLPVALWLLQPVFGWKRTDQEEAAELDGASRVSIFLTIVVPMAASGIVAAALLILVLCWNEYLFAAYLTIDKAVTLPPWLVGQLSMKEAQVGGGSEELGRFSAAVILMLLPQLAIAGFASRALVNAMRWNHQNKI
jgi:multiple sugar transport system permease protein